LLSVRNVVPRSRVFDPTQGQFHVVYLILPFLRFWATILCGQVFFEIVDAGSPPPAALGRMGAEDPTREMKGLKVPLHFLISAEWPLTYWANWGLLRKGREG
jgi:hypothetical protein